MRRATICSCAFGTKKHIIIIIFKYDRCSDSKHKTSRDPDEKSWTVVFLRKSIQMAKCSDAHSSSCPRADTCESYGVIIKSVGSKNLNSGKSVLLSTSINAINSSCIFFKVSRVLHMCSIAPLEFLNVSVIGALVQKKQKSTAGDRLLECNEKQGYFKLT